MSMKIKSVLLCKCKGNNEQAYCFLLIFWFRKHISAGDETLSVVRKARLFKIRLFLTSFFFFFFFFFIVVQSLTQILGASLGIYFGVKWLGIKLSRV